MDIKDWQKKVYQTAKNSGFHNGEPDEIAKYLMSLHAEVSELWEEYRNGHSVNEVYEGKGGKPEGIPVELADVIIRVLDAAEAFGIDIEKVMELKDKYNKTRPYRHGNKLA